MSKMLFLLTWLPLNHLRVYLWLQLGLPKILDQHFIYTIHLQPLMIDKFFLLPSRISSLQNICISSHCTIEIHLSKNYLWKLLSLLLKTTQDYSRLLKTTQDTHDVLIDVLIDVDIDVVTVVGVVVVVVPFLQLFGLEMFIKLSSFLVIVLWQLYFKYGDIIGPGVIASQSSTIYEL